MPPKPDPQDTGFPVYQPTPTQEENDLAAVGETVMEKEPDGSDTVTPVEPPTQHLPEHKPNKPIEHRRST